MSEQLKPCPFCGKLPEVIENFYGDYVNHDAPGHPIIIMALVTWNARPIEDAQAARIAELEEQAETIQGDWLSPVESAGLRARIAALEAENARLRGVCDVANLAMIEYDNYPGATTRQAIVDSMWRLRRALQQAGFQYTNDTLDWRGSILKELNDAGFYPSTSDPYHATQPDFVYDPDAPKNKRIFGNAVGQTIAEIVAELSRLREAERWVPVGEGFPKNRLSVEIKMVNNHGKRFVTVAEYVAPRSVLAEDYLDPDYTGDGEFSDYDEENDRYWAPSGFYETQYMTDVNWHIDPNVYSVTHWRELPPPPDAEAEAAAKEDEA